MDLGRFDYLLSVGLMKHSLRRGWVPVLAGVMVRYRRSLQAFQSITLRTRLVGWDGPWLYLEQTITGPQGLASVAYLKGVVKGKRGKVTVDHLLKAAGFEKQSPELPQAFRDFIAAEQAMYDAVKAG
jgi:acyl-CoA thioesterase FadM